MTTTRHVRVPDQVIPACRLKLCASADCRWAFYDTSRNGGGRWCSMEVCGNRHKTRAYRRRLAD